MDVRWQYLVNFATDATVRVLLRRQLSFVLCGEMARAKHIGWNTLPSKVEIMVISHNTILEDLKWSIVREQPNYFSLRAANMLQFQDYSLSSDGQRSIDVDLTLSGNLFGRVPIVGGFPIAPYPYLILRKLEDWDGVRASPEGASVNLERSLSNEIITMLRQYNAQRHTVPGGPFDPVLRNVSVERVAGFSAAYPKSKYDWRRLGFIHFTSPDGTRIPPKSRSVPEVKLKTHAPPAIPTKKPTPSAPPADTASPVPKLPTAADKTRKRRPMVSRTQVRNLAAKAAVTTLHELGIPCAIFGSMGCRMFGNPRPPNDVDILLLPPPGDVSTQEDFKVALVARDPAHFFLKDARDPEATYKVLHYRVDESSKKETSKVDILLPGVMHLPALPLERVVWQRRGENVFPVVPFSVLLLQKIQGWDDHRTAAEQRYIKKAPVDVADLGNMLRMQHVRPLMVSRPWSDRTLFSEEFEQRSRERVLDFCTKFPEHKAVWQRLGFHTEVLHTDVLQLAELSLT